MALNYQKHANKSETEYYGIIHSYLKYREIACKMIYRSRSPQIHMRPMLVKNIKYISKAYNISNICVHSAVSLMDFFMDNHDLKFDTVMLVSFACLTLAAKVEENCSIVPKLNCILNAVGKDVTNSYFRQVEMKVLTFFNFNVSILTVAHFIEYYHCENNYLYGYKVGSVLKDKFDHMVLFYQDLILENTKFISFNPSVVAASIILATRHKLGLIPCWTAQLRKLTGYVKKDLVYCCSLLGSNVMQHRKDKPVDDGYYSSSPVFGSPANTTTKKKRNRIDLPSILSSKRLAF